MKLVLRSVLKYVLESDLYLVHWPVALNPKGNHPAFPKLENGSRDRDESRTIEETWKDMEALVRSGKAKAIGVCNCSIVNLQKIVAIADVMPAVNQGTFIYTYFFFLSS